MAEKTVQLPVDESLILPDSSSGLTYRQTPAWFREICYAGNENLRDLSHFLEQMLAEHQDLVERLMKQEPTPEEVADNVLAMDKLANTYEVPELQAGVMIS